jgi:nucleolar protein 53
MAKAAPKAAAKPAASAAKPAKKPLAAAADRLGVSIKKKLPGSRKGKKAWRKNVDITEVEERLEELRREELTG